MWGGAEVQSAACMNMLHILYLWMPMVLTILITLILRGLNVEKAVVEQKEK